MNNHFKKIWILLKAIGNQLKQWFLELSLVWQIVVVATFLVLILSGYRFLTRDKIAADVEVKPRAVTLSNVGDLSSNNSPIPLSGLVTSVSEATIRAESSGKLNFVSKKLGDRVYAGEIIASFENSGERAAVQQAEGSYEAAKAARDIANINTASANANSGDIRTVALNAVSAALTTMDDSVRGKTDAAFVDPRFSSIKLKLLIPDSILQSKLEQERTAIEAMLVAREARNKTLTSDTDFALELKTVQTEVQTVKSYLDDLASAYAKALPNSDFPQASIDAQKGVLSGVRSTITGTLSSISSTKSAWTSAMSAAEIAGRTTGDSNPNTSSADANVKIALGSYNAALSRLNKTIIRSPITGTLNSLTIETGDFVGQNTQVAVVSNNGALEIQAYVSEDDAKRISVGSSAIINQKFKGVVTRIAGAVDPLTKKIEVKVGILDENAGLINGQSVQIEISNTVVKNLNTQAANQIKVPLSAVKITPHGSFVFTLSTTSALTAVTVETGRLLGEEIEITSGLTSDMQIVKDVRGLKEGQVVDVEMK